MKCNFCACAKPGLEFLMSYVVVCSMPNELTIVRFVDIGGIIDHRWLNFLSIP